MVHENKTSTLFPYALGVALIPTEATQEKILAITDEFFEFFSVAESIRLTHEKIPHVSIFQNMFRKPQEFVEIGTL